MKIVASIALQAFLLALALAITSLRCWVRMHLSRQRLTIDDYLVWVGWLFMVGWFTCSSIALAIVRDHPLVGPERLTDSVKYLKVVFISTYFFDIGLYCPKASLLAFYWRLVPLSLQCLRTSTYIATAYTACAAASALLVDTLIARPISSNWSVQDQTSSTWNSGPAIYVNWSLNWSTDLILFILPFFFLRVLKLHRCQMVSLCGVFSLGLITMAISLSRFIKVAFATDGSLIDDASGNLWYTAEMCTAVVVVSLPMLKPLMMRMSPKNTSDESASGEKRNAWRRSGDRPWSKQPENGRRYVQAGNSDEAQLTMQQ
ncbi:hypothetical protein IQ06DRAFT_289715 [Phaeosphaeriaceae sp. SRC1lsM3a]|nr:hypothetical protein IQ06DRAFT_289715 [Stagonospora sp. SRC1lsM3a]